MKRIPIALLFTILVCSACQNSYGLSERDNQFLTEKIQQHNSITGSRYLKSISNRRLSITGKGNSDFLNFQHNNPYNPKYDLALDLDKFMRYCREHNLNALALISQINQYN